MSTALKPGLQKFWKTSSEYRSSRGSRCDPRIFDCFMLLDELDMLACRLTELYDVVDRFVIVESSHTHQGTPKPSNFLENKKRFEAWLPKVDYIWAESRPGVEPITRDREQREWFFHALGLGQCKEWDIVLQSDLDEIPDRRRLPDLEESLWRVAGESKFLAFQQRLHCFAVDWEHPIPWMGTVAARRIHIDSMAVMRDQARIAPYLTDGGHHLSWLGGAERAVRKLEAFAHPEIGYLKQHIAADKNRAEGKHVDGLQQRPVDIDSSWPYYIRQRHCPESWFRPR